MRNGYSIVRNWGWERAELGLVVGLKARQQKKTE
jgi:hypothetical protein